ncbi:MAG: Bax inhibitor-1/YccA family protein [Deltaproteobacteria bacterium]|nr:Bax inhibitor-1/YccA family protein [Deltaproteobacteria bacterium]
MQTVSIPRDRSQVLVNDFVRSVYNWMALGLGLTGIVAFYVAHSEPLLKFIFGNQLMFWGLIIGELVLVFSISGRITKMSAQTATGLFLLYSALNGATLSFIFIVYSGASVARVFFITAGTFAVCSVYGMTTKRDLTSVGGFLFMGLVGIIIASLVNLFIKSSAMTMIISYIGVIVFVGLTAYDTQRIKEMALSRPAGLASDAQRKGAILGALSLYLDFINLFLMMLRIFGGSRD